VIEGVAAAEQLGAEIAFIAEDINCRDSFELSALSALRTERIRLATGVVNPYTRNPTSLAMAIATLDEVSNGRALLGLGTSSPSLIQEQMGIPIGRPVRVMRETTEIVRALLQGSSVTYEGERHVYHDALLEAAPVQARIPIYFAAMGPLMLTLAGRIADGVLLNVGASPQYVRWAVARIGEGAESAGRAPEEVTVAAWMTAYVTDDYQAGLQKAREWLSVMLSIPRQGELLLERGGLDTGILQPIRAVVSGYPHRGDRAAAAAFIPPAVADQLTLIGSPDRVRARLAEYRAAGVDVPVLGPSALQSLYG
jgi:5,10-methylenetetrahydromethanopterin reductase